MPDKKSDKQSIDDDSRESFDDIDEDLINLSAPPPDLRVLLFTVVILVLSCVMVVWFLPEARYLAAAFRDPAPLGEAADIDLKNLKSHTYVAVDGFPLIQRTLTFKEGVKWFTLSDNTRKFFPLAGQPHLYVQWAETDEQKAYRDPETQPGTLGPPAHFEGHLVRRGDLGENYDRIWVFYDCLKLHYLGRCNSCLGKINMDQCREAFTCAENNGEKACEEILEHSEEPLGEEIGALEKSGGNSAKLAELKRIRTALREQRIAVASVTLEELATRARRLQPLSAAAGTGKAAALKKIRAEVLGLRVEELGIRAANARRTVSTLDEDQKREIKAQLKELPSLRSSLEEQTKTLKTLKAFVQVGEALDKLRQRVTAIRSKAGRLPAATLEELSEWNPDTSKGKEIRDAVAALEMALVDLEKAEGTEAKVEDSAAGSDKAEDAARDPHRDGGVAEVSSSEPPPETLSHPAYQTLVIHLDAISKRILTLLEKIDVVRPGDRPALDQWATKPDVLGDTPEPIRERNVIDSIHQLETFFSGTTPAPSEGETVSLVDRYNDSIERLDALKKKIEKIENRPGAFEMGVETRLADLEKSAALALTEEQADALDTRVDELIQYMTLHKLYLARLKGAPDEMAKLEKILKPDAVSALSARVDAISRDLSDGDWVVIDGEIPLDKLWVVLVYAVLVTMMVINTRKIWRFWRAYRS